MFTVAAALPEVTVTVVVPGWEFGVQLTGLVVESHVPPHTSPVLLTVATVLLLVYVMVGGVVIVVPLASSTVTVSCVTWP
jgi:hypothetical protein